MPFKKRIFIFEFQIGFLEKLGCEFASLILTPTGDILQLASNKGQHYLNANPDVDLRFREHFGKQILSLIYRNKSQTSSVYFKVHMLSLAPKKHKKVAMRYFAKLKHLVNCFQNLVRDNNR